MSEHLYLISIGLVFGTPIVIFGMKYWSAAQQARTRIGDESAYRKLAAEVVSTQSGNVAALSGIRSDISEVKTRLTAIEKILKEVE